MNAFRKAFGDLQKSKNVRAQKKKIFGTHSAPKAGSDMQHKHIKHIADFAHKFLGLKVNPSGGKIDEKTGERRNEDAEVGVDKPDWRSGQLEAQWNPDAIVHEIAHLMLLPEGVGLQAGQKLMDKQYGDVQRQYGYMKQKRSAGEVQPMAAEQLIRRVLGLPANRNSVAVPSKDAPPRTAVEDNSVIGTRVKTGKNKKGEEKWADLIRQSRFLTPENKERMENVFSKKIIFHPEAGWIANPEHLSNTAAPAAPANPKQAAVSYHRGLLNKLKGQQVDDKLNEGYEKLAAAEMGLEKSPYGPSGFHLYSDADNMRRKEHRSSIGANRPTATKQAAQQAARDQAKSKKNPVKIFTQAEINQHFRGGFKRPKAV